MYHNDKSIESTELLDTKEKRKLQKIEEKRLQKLRKEEESRERWLRRGHTRRPNTIVRGLYWIFDKIQDFVPMCAAFFRWIGRVASSIGSFLISSALFIVNLFILSGTITLSVGHSHELLVYAGMAGWMAWIAVAVWESAFIYSSFVIESDYKKGRPSGWAPWTGFIMGFIFVEVSNFTGMADNLIGKMIGIATPILLLVSKGIMAHQFKPRKNEQAVTQKSFMDSAKQWFNQSPKTDAKSGDHTTQNDVTLSPENEVVESPETVTSVTQNPVTQSPENQVTEAITQSPETDTKLGDAITSKLGDTESESVTQNEVISQEDITASDEKLDAPRVTEDDTTSPVTLKVDENEQVNHPVPTANQVEAITSNEVESVTQNNDSITLKQGDLITQNVVTQSPENESPITLKSGDDVTQNPVTQSPEMESKSGDDTTLKSGDRVAQNEATQSPENESESGDEITSNQGDESPKRITKNEVTKKKLVTKKSPRKKSSSKKSNVVRFKNKQVQEIINTELQNSKKSDEIKKAIDYIFEYEEKNNKPPTINLLEKENFTNHQAKEARRIYSIIISHQSKQTG